MQQLLELPLGAYAPRGPTRPERVVLPTPLIAQGLHLSRGGEQLCDQKLVPKPDIKQLGKDLLSP